MTTPTKVPNQKMKSVKKDLPKAVKHSHGNFMNNLHYVKLFTTVKNVYIVYQVISHDVMWCIWLLSHDVMWCMLLMIFIAGYYGNIQDRQILHIPMFSTGSFGWIVGYCISWWCCQGNTYIMFTVVAMDTGIAYRRDMYLPVNIEHCWALEWITVCSTS